MIKEFTFKPYIDVIIEIVIVTKTIIAKNFLKGTFKNIKNKKYIIKIFIKLDLSPINKAIIKKRIKDIKKSFCLYCFKKNKLSNIKPK